MGSSLWDWDDVYSCVIDISYYDAIEILLRAETDTNQRTMLSPTKPVALSKGDFETLAAFRYALRRFLSFSAQAARAHGVTPQQYQSLLVIQGFPGRDWVTVGELAERMQITHHSAVGLVDRLEAMKLGKRTPSREDRRRVHVSLTPKGIRVLSKLYEAHRNELRVCGPQLASLIQKAASRIPAKTRYSSPPCSMPEIED